eukprot:366333-Chlamydomonas_euryale.AAC.3
MACLVLQIWPDPEDHWLAHAGGLGDITNDNAAVQYISAFYYVFTTMTTVGYGGGAGGPWPDRVVPMAR